jgi:hypothetical protein
MNNNETTVETTPSSLPIGNTDVVRCDVLTQGAIQINHAYVYQGSSVVFAIAVDMRTKRADVLSTGCDENGYPTVALTANEGSCHLKKGVEREAPTEICFPQFKDWAIWSVDVSRYTIAVCLVKSRS